MFLVPLCKAGEIEAEDRAQAETGHAAGDAKKHAAKQRTEQSRDDHDPRILCVHLGFPCFRVKAHKVQPQQHAEG